MSINTTQIVKLQSEIQYMLTSVNFLITNIKFSIKLDINRQSFMSLPTIDRFLNGECINSKLVCNFLRIRDKYVYMIYPGGHVNVTGVRSFQLVDDAVQKLEHLIPFNTTVINTTIDNISATARTPNKINLYKLSRIEIPCSRTTYNTQKFPGLFLRCVKKCTLIIFATGSIVIIGGKNVEVMQETLSYLWPILTIQCQI